MRRMQLQINHYFIQFLIFYNLFFFINTKTLIGENVRQVQEGEFKFVVSIGKTHLTNPNLFRHFCTGALISNRDVLTCDHCVKDQDQQRVRIIIGSRDLRQGVKYVPMWWLNYEDWANHHSIRIQFMINDIAIIRLTVNVTNTIQPVELTYMTNPDMVGMEVDIAGWGKKEDGQNPMVMDTVKVSVISLRECQRRVHIIQGRPIFFEPTCFCTSTEPFALVHQGDSGGPVIYMNTLIGFTKGTCPFPDIHVHPQKLNVHFCVYFYREFIESVVNTIP